MKAKPKPLNEVEMLIPGSGIDSPVKPKWDESSDEWLERSAQITRKKIDVLADAFANGEARTPAQIRKLAKAIGHSEREVKMWKQDARFNSMVTERLRTRALHAACEALDGQTAAAVAGNPIAFDKLIKVAEVVKPAGPTIQTNTLIDARKVGDTDSDKAFFHQFRNRVEKRLPVVESDERP